MKKGKCYLLLYILIFLFIGIYIGNAEFNEISEYQVNLTKNCCCNGNYCSDTYFSCKDKKCHLSLCENNPYMNNCTYTAVEYCIQNECKLEALV